MATYTAVQAGDWWSATTWQGGNPPVMGGDVNLGGFTITCSDDPPSVNSLGNGILVSPTGVTRFLVATATVSLSLQGAWQVPTMVSSTSNPGIANVKNGITYRMFSVDRTGIYDPVPAAKAQQFATDQDEVRERANSIIAPDRGGQLILGIEGTAQAITSGGGSIIVNHDFGGTDALRVLDTANLPVENVEILAYLSSDYALGGRRAIAAAFTASDGRWQQNMKLNSGNYELTFDAPGKRQYRRTITVSEG